MMLLIAFTKTAKLLGLKISRGPEIKKMSVRGKNKKILFAQF